MTVTVDASETSHRQEENINKAQVIQLGGSGVMQWQDWPVMDTAPGDVRLRHTALGVSHAGTFRRADISRPWAVPEPQTINGPS